MKTCTVEGCDRKHYGKGLCNMHSQRLRKRGTTEDPPRGIGSRAGSIVRESKTCSRCKEEKLAELFPKAARSRDGLHTWCKACMSWNTLRWKKANPGYVEKRTENGVMRYSRRYGVEPEDYFALLAGQGGVCAICRQAPKQGPLHIDHDHADGRVRGLLCRPCNLGLGNFGDDPDRITAAMAYLMQHTDVLGEVAHDRG